MLRAHAYNNRKLAEKLAKRLDRNRTDANFDIIAICTKFAAHQNRSICKPLNLAHRKFNQPLLH